MIIEKRYDAQAPLVAWDTETELFWYASMAPRVVCHAFAWFADGQTSTGLLHREEGGDEMARLFESAARGEIVIVGHNLAYDVAVLLRQRPNLWPVVVEAYERGNVHCTMIAEWLIDTAKGLLKMQWDEEKEEWKANKSYSLEALAMHRLHAMPYKDEWRMRYAELYDVPCEQWPEAASVYPQKDTRYTLEIAAQQRAEAAEILPHDPLVADLAAQCRAYLSLHLASCWGLELDPEGARRLQGALARRLDALAEAPVPGSSKSLLDAGVLRRQVRGKDVGKLSRVMDAIHERVAGDCVARGVPVPMTSGGKSGQPKVKCSGEVLADATDPFLQRLSDWQETQKLKTSFVDRAVALNRGPIHPRYSFAETGRTTCSGSKRAPFSFNLQQLPRAMVAEVQAETGLDVRSLFVARPGCVLSSSDYSALELCTFAQVLHWMVGYSKLGDAINQGLDPHLLLAAEEFLGVSYEDALALLKAKDPTTKDMRQLAKAPNFGFPGGMGGGRLAQYAKASYGIEFVRRYFGHDKEQQEKKGYEMKAAYTRAWPETKDFYRQVGDLVGGDGGAVVIQFVSQRLHGGVGYTDACNGFFQGLAADGAKAALWNITKECYLEHLASPLLGSRVVGFVHDEFLGEHPEERAHEAAERLATIARETMQAYCPDVKIKIEPALMRRWYKGAETVRDNNGRLQPWQPERREP